MSVGFKIDRREFDATIRKYAQYNRRDIPTIVNSKAYRVAIRCISETPKVSAEEIREFINQDGGKIIGEIINKQRGARGEKGLYGQAMKKAIAMVRASRLRSRAFLKSGWVWAVKDLAAVAEKRGSPRMDRSAKAIGQAKGKGIPASQGWRVVARIINTVTAKWDRREGAEKVAVPAAQRSFDAESADMDKYIESHFHDSARKAGIKTR